MRHSRAIAAWSVIAIVVFAASGFGPSTSAAAGTPYLSALSSAAAEGSAAPNPLCNLKQCTGKNRCRGSQVLSHCALDAGTGTCVTQSCTR